MKVLVAVPVFNEEKYVAPVLREIRKYARATAMPDRDLQTRVLVIDDGSTDNTAAVLADLAAKGHIDLLTHPENRGYGQSLIDAFRFAAEQGYEWVITMDCDEQHEPCRIPIFIRELKKDDADIISGSRYLKLDEQSEGAPPRDRRSINQFITEFVNSTLQLHLVDAAAGTANGRNGEWSNGRRGEEPSSSALADSPIRPLADSFPSPGITDAFCGFKAHRVSAMEKLRLTIPGYAFPMQFWVQAAAHRLRIREIPVKLIYKDPSRHFGGMLDDPSVRLQHYLAVLSNEIEAVRENPPVSGVHALACSCCRDR